VTRCMTGNTGHCLFLEMAFVVLRGCNILQKRLSASFGEAVTVMAMKASRSLSAGPRIRML